MIQEYAGWDDIGAVDFPSLLRHYESGDDSASRAMVMAIHAQLGDFIRKRIAPRFRSKFDEEDVMQSVLRSFFVRSRNGEFDLRGWESLWSILFLIARRKVGRRIQHYSTQKRDCRREIPGENQVLSRFQNDPAIVVEYSEILQLLFNELNERDRLILDMHLSFCTVLEISQSLEIAERTVHRVLARIRSKMHDLLDLP